MRKSDIGLKSGLTDRKKIGADQKIIHLDREKIGADSKKIRLERREIHMTRETNRVTADMDYAMIHVDRCDDAERIR